MGQYAVRFLLWVDTAPISKIVVTVTAGNKDLAIEAAREKVERLRPDADVVYDDCQYIYQSKKTGSDTEALPS
jgi:hypothetical protein